MDDIRQTAIDRFRAYLERRQFSAHTVANYTLDLRLFFAEISMPLAQVSFREVDQCVERQHHSGRAWATINRRLNALKHFFAFGVEQQLVRGNPVKPSHFVRRGYPLPKALSREQVGVPGVISGKFSVREMAMKSPLVTMYDYIRKNNMLCSM